MRSRSYIAGTFRHRCGGSIISSKIVITAAHCVYSVPASRLDIVAGSSIFNGYGTVVAVERVFYHKSYNKKVDFENDIAILVLVADLPLNGKTIQPIEMVEKKPQHGAIATVTGWGTTTEGGSPSTVLLEANVPIISNDVCEGKSGSNGQINDSMLCAGFAKGGVDACQGDSGGPLIVDNKLAGIVSWGDGCARPDTPGVYADIANLRPWIDDIISANP